MSNECGVYQIRCEVSGRIYIGSSCSISDRWYMHRRELRLGTHHSKPLQRAWSKHGESSFAFSVLEECEKAVLLQREQFYMDSLRPQYNVCKVAGTPPPRDPRMHCPNGHGYTPENTYVGKRSSDKRCRQCAAERAAARIAAETPEQTAARLARGREYLARNRESKRQKAREYGAANRENKRAYDKAYKAKKRAINPRPTMTGKDRIRAALAARGITV